MTEPQDGHRVEAVDRALRLLVMLADAGPAGATLAELANRTLELGENEPEVACIGTAILRAGTPVTALSITTLAARMTNNASGTSPA